MATEISSIFDAIDSAVTAVCEGESYVELYWPVELNENDDLTLRKGYGWFFSGSQNPEFFNSAIRSFNRNFTVVLTAINRATKINAASRKSVEKSLLETQRNLISTFESRDALRCETGPVTFNGDGGFETLDDVRDQILVLTSDFTFEYRINL